MNRFASTILLGSVLLLLLAPVTQFLTVMAVNASAETAVPVAWALGPIAVLAALGGCGGWIARRRWLAPESLVILYAMLALGVPLMNIGLARSVGLGVQSATREYVFQGTNTYRTAYTALDDRWFPKVPTRAGLAWAEAGRLLRQLRDEQAVARRVAASRRLGGQLDALAREGTALPETAGADLAVLGADEIQQLEEMDWPAGFLAESGWETRLREQKAAAAAASRAARQDLAARLQSVEEVTASYLPSVWARLDASTQARLLAARTAWEPAREQAHAAAQAALEAAAGDLGQQIAALTAEDRVSLQIALAEQRMLAIAALPEAAFLERRTEFLNRLNRLDRLTMLEKPTPGGPNEDLVSTRRGHFVDLQSAQRRLDQSLWENVTEVVRQVPWTIWAGPLLRWSVLLVAIFAFLMVLAEWLRRKWVERENLAFPLVDLVEQVLRSGTAPEVSTEDGAAAPTRRPRAAFLIGLAIGFAIIAAEGLGHYEFLPLRPLAKFDFSRDIFTSGALREIAMFVLVVSPITVGVLYLVSLELSFSIWASFLLYILVTFGAKLTAADALTDGRFTGFGDGKVFPFPAEQLLGAVMAYGLISLLAAWKTCWRPGREVMVDTYVGRPWVTAGLFLLPAVILAMGWQLGVESALLLLVLAVPTLLHTVAAARVRAETGLPGAHHAYDFTKLPMILGITGTTGARPFAAYLALVFLPLTLLFRTLPQQLENLELARRFRVPYRTLAGASALAVVVAIGAGLFTFIIGNYYLGDAWAGGDVLPAHKATAGPELASTPLWVAHFLGEAGLTSFTEPNLLRLSIVAIGFGVVVALVLLRRRFFSFPLHPVGYVVMLLSIHLNWTSRYLTSPEQVTMGSTLWGSALVAWIIKKLVVKYGGVEMFRRTRPLFIGLAVGGVLAVFAFNVVDFVASAIAAGQTSPGAFLQRFTRTVPFSPAVY